MVDANPPVADGNGRWSRADYDKGTLRIETSDSKLRSIILSIPAVERNDIDAFTCDASNDYGSATKVYKVKPVDCMFIYGYHFSWE